VFVQISPVRYTCQPTGTSCLSSRRPATLPASPTQSPTKTTVTTTTIAGPASTGSRRGSRKHVQFPDFEAPNLKSNDLLHANWKQGSSPPLEQCAAATGISHTNVQQPGIVHSLRTSVLSNVSDPFVLNYVTYTTWRVRNMNAFSNAVPATRRIVWSRGRVYLFIKVCPDNNYQLISITTRHYYNVLIYSRKSIR